MKGVSALLMWEVTFQRSLPLSEHNTLPLPSPAIHSFFGDRDESTLSKTHYKLDKLVAGSGCTLSRCLLLRIQGRSSSDDLKEWSPCSLSDLGAEWS